MPELELNRETVQFVIERARAFHAKEQVTITETPLSPSDDWAMQSLADHADDAVVAELTHTVNDLEPDQQVSLIALLWLGRGDFTIDEWGEALAQAGDSWNERCADYLLGSPLAGDYLAAGLSQFDNVDNTA